jgi:hypothetical protein
MDIFINECSLHEQFVEYTDFEPALKSFFQLLNTILSKRVAYKFYQRSDLLYVYKAVRNREFIASLNALKDKSFKSAINNVIHNKLNARDWTQEQMHLSDDNFTCNGEDITDTCMAELAERIVCKTIVGGLLINFPQSKFQNLASVTVEKNNQISTELDCTDNVPDLTKWFEDNFKLSQFEYNLESREPPLDSQTVLRDSRRFQKTNLQRQGGRALYRETETNLVWYVDNLHFGASAHLEVFDSTGQHIGEADIEHGNLDHSRSDPSKHISF